jgi:hypothetical protein
MASLAAALTGCLALTGAGTAGAEGSGDSGDSGGSGGSGGAGVRTELVQAESTATAGNVATAVAACPFGQQLMGVGATVLDGKAVAIQKIVPNLVTNTVEVVGRYVGLEPIFQFGVQATAVCAWGLPKPYLAQASSSSVTGQRLTSTAQCNAGDKALGVGFDLTGATGNMLLTDLLPTGSQASVTLEESIAGMGVGAQLTTSAICAKMDAFNVVQAVAVPLVPWLDAIGLGVHAAVCPLGFRVTGGGVGIDTDVLDVGKQVLSMTLPLVEATGTFLAARLPLLGGLPGQAGKMSAYAICYGPKL